MPTSTPRAWSPTPAATPTRSIAEARGHADKVLSEAKAEAERNRRAAQRQVDELIRQRDSITGTLDQLRSLLGATMPMPGLDKLGGKGSLGDADHTVNGEEGVQTAGDIAAETEQSDLEVPQDEPATH